MARTFPESSFPRKQSAKDGKQTGTEKRVQFWFKTTVCDAERLLILSQEDGNIYSFIQGRKRKKLLNW